MASGRGGPTVRCLSGGTARRVADFLHKYLRPHAVAFYGNVLGLADNHDLLVSVAGHILAHRLDLLTSYNFQRGSRTMRAMNRTEISGAMEQLEALGWLEPVPPPKNSSRPRWMVNPLVHVRFADRAEKERQARDDLRAKVRGAIGGDDGA